MASWPDHLTIRQLKNDSSAIYVREWGRTIWIADAHCDDGKRFVAGVIQPLSGLADLGDHGKPRVSQLRSRCSQAAKYAPWKARKLPRWQKWTFNLGSIEDTRLFLSFCKTRRFRRDSSLPSLPSVKVPNFPRNLGSDFGQYLNEEANQRSPKRERK